MQLRTNSMIFILSLVVFGSSCAHMSDPCENKPLQRFRSPDGTLTLATYHRECASKTYTSAAIEKNPGFLQTRGEVVCHVMSWGDRVSIEAEWKNETEVFISTADRLEKFDFGESKESCGVIKIKYRVEFRNEEQKATDSKVISKLEKALAYVSPCIHKVYKSANPNNDVVADLNKMIRNGEHRSAVENILGYAHDANCPISPETYSLFKELSDIFDLKPKYLELVSPVRHSS
jgi:hypothetical protein